jgi:hypothetical protein
MTATGATIEQLARDATRHTDPEEGLRAVTALRHELDALEPTLVARALRAGASWSQVAKSLGVSKQAAHRKHRDAVAREEAEGAPTGSRILVTAEARRCVGFAREEARALGVGAVGTEHLLLGILRCRRSHAVHALHGLGVTLERAKGELQTTIADGEPVNGGASDHPSLSALGRRRDITPHTRRILEGALREAVKLRDGYIGVEHLLLALLADHANGAVQTLAQLGVTPEQLRGELERTWSEAARRVDAGAGAQQGARAQVSQTPARARPRSAR